MLKYMIIDWAGNRVFPTESFATFEDGWDFLLEVCPEEDLDNLLVVACGEGYSERDQEGA